MLVTYLCNIILATQYAASHHHNRVRQLSNEDKMRPAPRVRAGPRTALVPRATSAPSRAAAGRSEFSQETSNNFPDPNLENRATTFSGLRLVR